MVGPEPGGGLPLLRPSYLQQAFGPATRALARDRGNDERGHAMKRFRYMLIAVAASALVLSGTAAAALAPWTFVGSGASCPVVSTFHNGVLHLEKNCATT